MIKPGIACDKCAKKRAKLCYFCAQTGTRGIKQENARLYVLYEAARDVVEYVELFHDDALRDLCEKYALPQL
jgi:hypothetical protein